MTKGSDSDITHSDVPREAAPEQLGDTNNYECVEKALTDVAEGSEQLPDVNLEPAKRRRSDEDDEEEEAAIKRSEVERNVESSDQEKATSDSEKNTGKEVKAKAEGADDTPAHVETGAKEGNDKDDPKDTTTQKCEHRSLFDFASSLASSKEYVCPFSKLLENKKNENFLESTATTTTEIIDHTNVFSVITDADVTADNAPKSCEIQNSVKDDEVMLYENKSCTLACYKDGEWNTPVPVVLQLLEKKTKESKRIVCHQIGTGRLQLNSTMLPTMTMKKLKTKSIIFVGQLISDEATLAPHRVIFQDQTQRDIFLKHF